MIPWMNGSLSFLVTTSWPRFTLLTVPSFLNHFSPLPSPPLSAASFFLFLWLCLISSSHSLFYYLSLNVGFLLTTLSYLFMKNIHPGGIPSISLIGLLLIYLMSQPKPLNFTLYWWCAAASQLLHFQELCEPAAKPSLYYKFTTKYSLKKKGNKYLKLITS